MKYGIFVALHLLGHCCSPHDMRKPSAGAGLQFYQMREGDAIREHFCLACVVAIGYSGREGLSLSLSVPKVAYRFQSSCT
jgi:hypothetical protein